MSDQPLTTRLRGLAARMHPDATAAGANVRNLLNEAAKELDRAQKRVEELEAVVNVDFDTVARDIHFEIVDDDMRYRGRGYLLASLRKRFDPTYT